MAAGAAPLALKLDIFENRFNNDPGQENIPLKRKREGDL